MTSASVWGGIALAALSVLGYFVVQYARALIPMANAFKVFATIDEKFDDRVYKVVNRIREREGGNTKAMQPRVTGQEEAKPQSSVDAIRNLFGDDALTAVPDQPDAEGIEVVE